MEALTKQTYEQYVLDEKQTCLVLYIKDGCPICQELHPLIEEIAEGYTGQPFRFYYVDAIAEADLYKEMRLQGTPTVQFYRDGQLTNKFTGLREYEEIEFLISSFVRSA